MIYLEVDDKIVCYKVTIDKDKLRKIRLNIIYNCSIITNKITEEMSTYLVSNEEYNVYSCKYLRSIDRFYYEEPVYLVTYERRIHPDIVEKLNKLINGDNTVLPTLFNDSDQEKIKLEEIERKKQQLIDRLSNITSLNEQIIISLKQELENLQNMSVPKRKDKTKQPSDYYNEIRECIFLEKVKEIPKEVYIETLEFFKDLLPKCPHQFPKENNNIKSLKLKL